MKAITIHQPWASLIAIGAKRFETRGWKTNYRGLIAIHAGKQKDYHTCMMLAQQYPQLWREITPMSFGSIVATANLTECWKVIGIADVPQKNTHVLADPSNSKLFGITPDVDEFLFGDFSEGRFAWELTDVKMLDKPIPAKGQQGLWNWEGIANE